jgi:hypothetical protein
MNGRSEMDDVCCLAGAVLLTLIDNIAFCRLFADERQ